MIGPVRMLPLLVATLLLCSSSARPSMVWADTPASARAPAPAATGTPAPAVGGLDGVHLMLGPVASAVRMGDGWEGGFGGAISLIRVREHAPLAVLGIGLGGLRLARGDRGLLWGEMQVGSRRLAGLLTGLSAGVSAEVGEVISTRLGGHVTVWTFAGVVPYARIGMVRKSGAYVDFGIEVALPTLRF